VLPVHGLGEALLTVGTVVIEVTPSAWTVICEGKSGDGIVIIGLTPPLSISVAPSGMDPPESNDPDVAPGVKRGDTLPVDDTVASGAALQPLENIPPPSKVVPAAAPD
jgi:hypothetical protein